MGPPVVRPWLSLPASWACANYWVVSHSGCQSRVSVTWQQGNRKRWLLSQSKEFVWLSVYVSPTGGSNLLTFHWSILQFWSEPQRGSFLPVTGFLSAMGETMNRKLECASSLKEIHLLDSNRANAQVGLTRCPFAQSTDECFHGCHWNEKNKIIIYSSICLGYSFTFTLFHVPLILIDAVRRTGICW